MTRLRVLATAAVTMTLFGCASTSFVTSWKDPTAQPLEVKGAKVAAVAMVKDPTARKVAEDALAKAISEHGAVGIPMYQLVPTASPDSEAVVRAALEQAGVSGIVVMRPVAIDKETVTTPVVYSSPSYSGYYGGYYGYGWGSPWGPTMVSGGETYVDTIVSIETQIYSLKQNKLVWAGRSKTTNPEKVDQLVSEVARAASEELVQAGLIKH